MEDSSAVNPTARRRHLVGARCRGRHAATSLGAVAALLLAFTIRSSHAAEQIARHWLGSALDDLGTRPTLTSDWGGLRPPLAARGVTLSASYIGEILGNVRGGQRTGAIYDALFEVVADIDGAKLLGWPGAAFHAAAIYPHGASISRQKVGDLGGVSAIDAYDSLRLYEAWGEQKFFSERFSMRVGFLAADTDFAVMDTAAPFLHSAFGTPIALTNNFAMSTYPYSALGARLRFEPARGWSLMLGAYDGNVAPGVFPDPSPAAAPSNEFNHWGTHFALRADEGAMLFAEFGWRTPSPASDGKTMAASTLTFAYKFGAAYHTDKFHDVGDSARGQGTPRALSGNYALYGSVEQEVWRESGTRADGLSVFGRAAFAPEDRNLFQSSFETGLVYAGLWQSEARDRLALGGAWFDISDHVSDAQRRAGLPAQDFEAVIELTYQYQVTPWCIVQPDVQFIIHPGGSGETPNALILGMRTTVTF